jgi:hypothetical protein
VGTAGMTCQALERRVAWLAGPSAKGERRRMRLGSPGSATKVTGHWENTSGGRTLPCAAI